MRCRQKIKGKKHKASVKKAAIIIGAILFIFLFLFKTRATSALGETIIFQPTETAFVTSLYPDISFAEPEALEVGFTQIHKLAFIRFDLSYLPPYTKVLSATLSAYLEGGSGDEQVAIELLRPVRRWCAKDLTWNTKPALISASTASAVSLHPGWVSWDVSQLVRSWIDEPQGNTGVVLAADTGVFERRFVGQRGDNRPKLSVALATALDSDRLADLAKIDQTSNSGEKTGDSCQLLGSETRIDQQKILTLFSSGSKEWLVFLGLTAVLIGVFFVVVRLNHPSGAGKTDSKPIYSKE